LSKLKNNFFLNNLNGVLQVIAVNLVTSFAGLFLKRLNANDELVSLFNSLPAFFSILAIFIGGIILTNTKNKKRTTSFAFLITRFFYILIALVPFLPDKLRPIAFVILYSAMNFPNSIAVFLWQSFIADIFPPGDREASLASRSSIATIAGTATTLITGFLLTSLSRNKSQLITFYQIAFVIAFFIGIIEVITLLMHRERKNAAYAEVSTNGNKISLDFLINLPKHKEYFVFIICVIIFHFTWQMAWPLFLTYEVDYLKTNEMWAAIISTINGIAMAYGYRFWGRFSKNNGNSAAITIASLGMALAPFFYSISTKIYHVTYFVALTGFSVSGVMLLLLNSLYEVSPRENRTSFIAFYNLVTNITLVISPWIGMRLSHFTGIKSAFVIVGFLRILSGLTFLIRHKKQQAEVL